jgi:hypothetical protein
MMDMHQTTGNRTAIRSRLLAWLADQTRSAGHRMFRSDDALATASGWQITTGRWGLSRTYRDPRFAALARCDRCNGSGQIAGERCARCAGAGRITFTASQYSQVAEPERSGNR